MLSVRELAVQDIEKICDYWLTAEDSFLLGMGVDLSKMPSRDDWSKFLNEIIVTPLEERPSFCTIWVLDERPIGHCNVAKIKFGEEAYMHLHVWNEEDRAKGLSREFLKLSIPIFFEKLQLKELFCEPWAENPAPNKALPKAGFEFSHSYFGVPGWLNFEQEVNVYRYKTKGLTVS
jgi:RimJ/RimL family protein N-acetyltransferase